MREADSIGLMYALSRCGLAAFLALAAAGPSAAQGGFVPPPAEEESQQPAPPMPERDVAPGEDSVPNLSPSDSTEAPVEPPTLDTLFADLKRERSDSDAAGIASQIQAEWLKSGSATVDLLMGWANQAISEENSGAALDLLEQAMLIEPEYAEAWNARATLNFQLSNYGRSLSDIEQTLAREPRHFGALMGLGAILEELGRPKDAFDAYRRVLEVYPALRSAQDAVARLADEVGGQSL